MELRRPAAFACAQCPHRNGPGVQRPSGAAGRQPPPSAQAQARPSSPAQAQARPSSPAQAQAASARKTPAVPEPPPSPPAQRGRAYLSAYAEGFTVTVDEGGQKVLLPLAAQRAAGMAISEGRAAAPEDGYYMLLWELGVGGAEGKATMHLGVNEAASQLTYPLRPGYDSGQQVTWLSAGDEVGLFLQAEDENAEAEVQCTSAQFTVIRLG